MGAFGSDNPGRARLERPAFTLIEMIVVLTLLGVLMALAVPRMIDRGRRDLQSAADQVADLLVMFAQRDALAARPVGIWHDAGRNWLVLVTLDVDPAKPDDPASWRPDRAVKPVKLPDVIEGNGVSVTADGKLMDVARWPAASEPGKPRPHLGIRLPSRDGRERTIVLPPHSIAPYTLDDANDLAAVRAPVDLDAAGRYREDW